MKSTIGRPRILTDEQVRLIMGWHAQILALRALRRRIKTQRQLATELGVSPASISNVIARGGSFKKG